ncbi:MAG: methyltransferase domain-containing protein [Armatimonadetes bacterium]|nr:methyltransferase domain-containing protein [Armatimonadota bacterium]
MTSKDLAQFRAGQAQFGKVAAIYDDLMSGISYDLWLRYVKQLWLRHGQSPHTVLDVACGTGNMSYLLAQDGYEVVGIDSSGGMIDQAWAKARNKTLPVDQSNPAFYCQNAAAIDLDQRFDAAISLFDSLNYLLEYEDLRRCFAGVARCLSPGSTFIFDVNTRYALSHRFFDQDNMQIGCFPLYKWRSQWDEQTGVCTIDMEFHALTDAGVEVFCETHRQRGYSVEELKSALLEAGFLETEFLQAFTFKAPRAKTDRLYVVAKLPGSERGRI